MKINIELLKQKLTDVAQKFVSASEAEYFAELIIDTHIKKSLRSNTLKSAISDIKNWQKVGAQEFIKKVDRSGVTVFDCQKLAPALKAKEIHNELLTKARKNGVAVVGVINSGGFHTLTFWTDTLEKEGVIALCMVNGGPACVVPFGAKGGDKTAVFGTNPISYSIPTTRNPISADMATSQIPYFEIADRKKDGGPLPKDSVLDADGNPTDAVDKTFFEGENANIAPLAASHKGSALMLFLEIMSSSLLGMPNSIQMNRERFVAEEHGNLIIAFDISAFTDLELFKKNTTSLVDTISNLQPRTGFEKVSYPGEGSHLRKTQTRKEGTIEVDEKLLEELEKLL